jgi:hypothetical protein
MTNRSCHHIIHYSKAEAFLTDYVELLGALLDGAAVALRFWVFAAALLAFLSAKKLIM